jgi:hypothetical protein
MLPSSKELRAESLGGTVHKLDQKAWFSTFWALTYIPVIADANFLVERGQQRIWQVRCCI